MLRDCGFEIIDHIVASSCSAIIHSHQVHGDYTATSGSTVVLAVGASVNDIVDIVSTGDGVSFRSTADASGDKFTLTNVGIGTDITPDKLNVRGNVSIAGITTFTNSAGVGDFKPIQLEKSGTSGASRIQFLENGTNKGGITYSHDNNRMELIAMSGNDIVFYSGGNLTTRISSVGHLGVGDDNPDTRLSVKAASGTDVVGKFTSTDANAWIQFRDNSTTDTAVMVGASGDNLLFRAGSNTRARILSGGEFAIGGSGYGGQPFSLQTSSTNLGYMETTSTTRGVMSFRDGNSTQNVGFGCIGNNHVFMKDGNEKVRIDSNGRMGIGNNNPQFMIHTEGSGNNGGVRLENSHTTTTVSGNTAAGAFPHNLILSNYGGSGNADNRMATLGFDIPTTGNHANAVIAYQATASNGTGDLQFWLENGNTSYERLRISSDGYITAPNNVAFSARGGPADITTDVIVFGTQVFQRGGTNYSTSTGIFTAPVAGIYHFMCNPYRYETSNDSSLHLQISTNSGSSWTSQIEIRNQNDYNTDSGRGWFTLPLSQLINLNANDQVRMLAVNRIHCNGVYSRFSGFLVG